MKFGSKTDARIQFQFAVPVTKQHDDSMAANRCLASLEEIRYFRLKHSGKLDRLQFARFFLGSIEFDRE